MRLRLIGDPHITRKFERNVPLARRGEREELLFNQFERELNEGDEEMVVMVGDLFEKPICSLTDLYRILTMVLSAAETNPERLFMLMAGNHDRSAQQNDHGAFDILSLFHLRLPNLFVLTEPAMIGDVAFFPWEWDRNALEQIEFMKGETFKTAIGHWDLVAYDDMHLDHFCPAQELVAMGAETIYSGHWHVAGDYVIEGITVHCTGSMQPMTHAEDPDGNMYVTMTLEEYEDADPETLRNKYVRVIVPAGEEAEPLADCLGFKTMREDSPTEPQEAVEVSEFKTSEVVKKAMEKHGVPSEVQLFIKERIDVND